MAGKPLAVMDALLEAYGPESVELLQSFLHISNPIIRTQVLKLIKTLAEEGADTATETNGVAS